MDVGPPPRVILPSQRTTSAVGDGDVGQKGSYYRRRTREKKSAQPEDTQVPTQDRTDESRPSIDIRV